MKLFFYRYFSSVIFFFILVALTGCSGLSEPLGYNDSESFSRVRLDLTLTVSDRSGSRSSGRILDNSDPAQRLSNMRVYLFRADLNASSSDDSAFKYCRPRVEGSDSPVDYFYIPAFEKDYTWNSEGNETHAMLIEPYLEKGYQYRLLAIGRDDIEEGSDDQGLLRLTTYDRADRLTDVSTKPMEATTLAEIVMAINLRGVRLQTSELFTGCSDTFVVSDDNEDFTASIIVSRSVAGMLMYIENIPTHFKALADFTRPSIMPPYEPMSLITKGKEYKVSSIAIAPTTITSMVGLLSRKACGDIATNDNFRGYFADINLADAQTDEGIFVNTNPENTAHPNSILCGNFILPIDAPSALPIIEGYQLLDHTLYLVFYTTDNDMDDHTFATPFFWYPIESVAQIYNPATGSYQDAPGGDVEASYALMSNHIYSLGEKYGNVDAPLDISALNNSSQSRSQNLPSLILHRME